MPCSHKAVLSFKMAGAAGRDMVTALQQELVDVDIGYRV